MACVLVIDDETTVGAVLRWAFGSKGHRTIAAEDGRTGIGMARAEHHEPIPNLDADRRGFVVTLRLSESAHAGRVVAVGSTMTDRAASP